MSTPRVLNAFESVRPRLAGAALAHAQAAQGKAGSFAQRELAAGRAVVLDCKGRAVVQLAPRAYGSVVVEGRAAAQASNDKRARIVRGGI